MMIVNSNSGGCVYVCVLYFPAAQFGHGHMAAVLEIICRSIYRASILSMGLFLPWPIVSNAV